ncbi:DUF924 domain-containing protein [Alginatibacterium sediminis]|uniref:DUF924 domain-containing protein n=1 Tax=Alginatibacterium sediminis TaxID=2164068 RepID=A0A420ED44_9ALTE|nr:DUF924 family protein [Alginatibacterium sediminis]RKF18591.1 DUF924 domain-containing protein [Alginatibacterium sediminis]
MLVQTVIEFWFDEIDPSYWFKKDLEFDALIAERFLEIHQKAVAGELFNWRTSMLGRLAEIIVLDQFSRNIFRDKSHAFSCDPLALCLCQHALELKPELELSQAQIDFLLMPLMHSESIAIHQQYSKIFKKLASSNVQDFELKHRVIIEQFGRYPHRNSILTRPSTAEELAFLKQGNSSF